METSNEKKKIHEIEIQKKQYTIMQKEKSYMSYVVWLSRACATAVICKRRKKKQKSRSGFIAQLTIRQRKRTRLLVVENKQKNKKGKEKKRHKDKE